MVFVKSILKQLVCTLVGAVFTYEISLASISINETTKDKVENYSYSYSPWRVFGGLGLGLGTVSGNDYQNSPQGEQFMVSGLLSYQMPRWVFDGGLSWIYSSIRGTNSQSLPISIQTRAGMLSISPRYRLTERWQIGPAFDLAFGTDTGFGPNINSPLGTPFLGVKVVYEIPYERFPLRVWSQLSTDVSVNNRQVYLGLVGVQIGIPIGISKESTSVKNSFSSTHFVQAPYVQKMKLILDPHKVFFSTNSATLKPDVSQILTSVAKYLNENPDDWKSLEISGHADQRGSYLYNLKLSQRRANSVSRALLKGGVPESQLSTEFLSFSAPLDSRNNKIGWAKNRRVELVINEVKNPEHLIELLKPLMTQQPWDAVKK